MKFTTLALTVTAAIIGSEAASMRSADVVETPTPAPEPATDGASPVQYEAPKPCEDNEAEYDEVNALSEPEPEPEAMGEPAPTPCPGPTTYAEAMDDYPAPAPAPAQYDGKSQYTEYHSSASKPAIVAAFVISTIAFAL